MTLGERLRTIRKTDGLTQDDFADKLDVSQSVISDIERDYKNPTLYTLRRIAHALDMTMSELLQGVD